MSDEVKNFCNCPNCQTVNCPNAKHCAAQDSHQLGGDFYNGIEWMACWLIDHAEGEIVSEELARPWAVEAWNKHLKQTESAPRNDSGATPRTISEDIERYNAMTPEDKRLVQTLIGAIIDLRCTDCGNPVPVRFEC